MSLRFALAPWWLQAPAYSVLFFALWTFYTTAADSRPDWVQCIIVAVVFGLIMGPISARRNRRELAPLVAGVAPGDYRQVSKALRIGPPPNDPVILHAAARLAGRRATQSMRERGVVMILAAVCVVTLVALAEGHSFRLAGYAMTVLLGAFAAHGWINPLLLQARSVILTNAAHQNPLPTGLVDTTQPSTPARQNPGLFSFRGRVVTAILVTAIGINGLWGYFRYHRPDLLWLSLFPLALGALGFRDAVKSRRAESIHEKTN